MNPRKWWILAGALVGIGGACAAPAEGCKVPAGACGGAAAEGREASPGSKARGMVAEGAWLLDVRTPEEFAAGHVEGAVNIPVQDLEQRLEEVPTDKPVVVYCQSGRRSAKAAEILRVNGHPSIFDMGPMSNW